MCVCVCVCACVCDVCDVSLSWGGGRREWGRRGAGRNCNVKFFCLRPEKEYVLKGNILSKLFPFIEQTISPR